MEHTITVGASGEASAEPDTAFVDLGVGVVRPTVAEAAAHAAAAARRLIDALVGAGVAADDISTSRYSVHPDYEYTGPEQRLRGFRVSNTVTARVRAINSTGAVLDAAVAAGGDTTVVDGIRFAVSDDSALSTAARAAAWEAALDKAAQLAELAGVVLGAVVSISEAAGTGVPRPALAMRAPAAADAAPPILPGETKVTVSLSVSFAIA